MEATNTLELVLDPGHGGSAQNGKSTPTGVVGPTGRYERDVVHEIALRTAERFGASAVLTRDTDNPAVQTRIAIAREHHVPVFLSIHANQGPQGTRGAESWVHTRANEQSLRLAKAIQRELDALGVPGRGVFQGDLAVLTPDAHEPDTAACLVEVDYLSDPDGEARLGDPAAVDLIGLALSRAVRGFLDGAPLATGQAVVEKRVTCAKYDRSWPIFREIGTDDPVAVITAANERAIVLLDNTIETMEYVRDKIIGGAAPGWPTMGDAFGVSVREQLRMDPDAAATWTGRGPGTIEIVIRWFKNVRKVLDGGELHYTCLHENCKDGVYAFVEGDPTRSYGYRIKLCKPWWASDVDTAALVLIHEVTHIYYDTEDFGRGPGAAWCLTRFVAITNDIVLHSDFDGHCD